MRGLNAIRRFYFYILFKDSNLLMNKKTSLPVTNHEDETSSKEVNETKRHSSGAIQKRKEPVSEIIDEHNTPMPEVAYRNENPAAQVEKPHHTPMPEKTSNYAQESPMARAAPQDNKTTADVSREQLASYHKTTNNYHTSSPAVVSEREIPPLNVINERIQKLEFFSAKLDTLLEHGKVSPEDYSNKKREVLKRLKPLKRLQASAELDSELADTDMHFRQGDSFKEKVTARVKRRAEREIEDDGSATRLSRLAAYLIDMLILAPFTAFYAWGAFKILTFFERIALLMDDDMPLYVYMIISLGGMCFNWTIYVAVNAFWLNKYGQTIGKRVMKIYIADVNNTEEKAEFIDILLKRIGFIAVIPLIPVIGGLIALIDYLMVFTTDKRCLHDMAAKTKVMRVKQ